MRRMGLVVLLAALLAGSLMVHAQEGGITHTVRQGETLTGIAQQYGLTVEELMAVNGLSDPDLIQAGQVLIIPMTATATPTLPPEPQDSPIHLEFDLPGAATPTPSGGEEPADLGLITTAGSVLPDGVIVPGAPAMRQVYLRGLMLGNNPHAFAKIGDCNSEPPFFLAKFDTDSYNLGPYRRLQAVIDHFEGSYLHESMAVWTGNHAWAVFDPTWANPAFCDPGESPIECEFRRTKPSLVLIRLGTNEAGQTAMFEENLRKIVEFSLEHGVIPVLGTKADRLEGSDAHNAFVRALAEEYGVPLWDFARLAGTLPGGGLMPDGFHMTWAGLDFTDPVVLNTGHGAQNLSALIVLDAVWHSAMY